MNEQSMTLYYRDGSSDKVYRAEILQRDHGYVVQFAFGRRGSTLQTGSKTPAPVNQEEALKVFQRLVKEKTAKGYTVGEDGTPYHGTENAGRDTGIRPLLLNPVDEEDVETYLDDPAFWMQEKYDGNRLLIRKVAGGVIEGINRRGLNVAIPEPVRLAAASLEGAFLFDGEIVGDTYNLFDCLERDGVDLRGRPYRERYATLPAFRSGCPIEVAATVKTARQKRVYYARLKGWGVEGVVFKRHDAPYTPERPASGGPQLKCKFYATASVIVAAINASKRSVAVEIYDGQRSVGIGNVSIPPNAEVPNAGAVIEVRYLYAYQGGALYQPTFIHRRCDVLPAECGIGHPSQGILKGQMGTPNKPMNIRLTTELLSRLDRLADAMPGLPRSQLLRLLLASSLDGSLEQQVERVSAPQTPNNPCGIPPALLERLQALRPVLEVQGVVQRRGKGWRLRYRDHESAGAIGFHKSLNLGRDSSTAMSVVALLEGWRFDHENGLLNQFKKSQVRTQISNLQRLAVSLVPKRKTGRPRKGSLWYREPASPNLFFEKLLKRYE